MLIQYATQTSMKSLWGFITLLLNVKLARFLIKSTRTGPLELCYAVEENGSKVSRRMDKVLVGQVTELVTIHIKVLEGDVGGINLVYVHDLLQPLPHLIFTPEVWLEIMRPQVPTCIARHHYWNWEQAYNMNV